MRELIEAILEITGSGGFEVPPSEMAPHEARLLKLDISKANTLLKWRPALSFTETAEFTVVGYLDELKPAGNLYEKRANQIKFYTKKDTENQLLIK